jgi:hypothetical protein
MSSMFLACTYFNQDISGWVVSGVYSWSNFRIDSGLTTFFTPIRFR